MGLLAPTFLGEDAAAHQSSNMLLFVLYLTRHVVNSLPLPSRIAI